MNDNVEKLLSLLEEEIRNAKRPMLAPNFKQVDENRCLDRISEIRYALPSEMAQARAVVQDKENIIAEARARADEILRQAENQANKLLDNNSIILQAQKEAQAIIGSASNNANDLYNTARESSFSLLDEIENVMRNAFRNALNEIAIGKQKLSD